ncbi:uncharacterized protein V1513DRAFT_436516 [Lipomyces chichibuensis]|uniref:uncharacterized protein n=1 Tax=Lipomyces chichibuensis TaxID=1546026 RepID=UPI003343EE77
MIVRAHARKRTRSPSQSSSSPDSSPDQLATVAKAPQRPKHRGSGIDTSILLVGTTKEAKYGTGAASGTSIAANRRCGKAVKFIHRDSPSVTEKFAYVIHFSYDCPALINTNSSEYIEAEMKRRNASEENVETGSSLQDVHNTLRQSNIDQVQSVTHGKLFEVESSHDRNTQSKSTSNSKRSEQGRSKYHAKDAYRDISQRLQDVLKESMSTSYMTPTFDRGKSLTTKQIEEQLIKEEGRTMTYDGVPVQARVRSRKR